MSFEIKRDPAPEKDDGDLPLSQGCNQRGDEDYRPIMLKSNKPGCALHRFAPGRRKRGSTFAQGFINKC